MKCSFERELTRPTTSRPIAKISLSCVRLELPCHGQLPDATVVTCQKLTRCSQLLCIRIRPPRIRTNRFETGESPVHFAVSWGILRMGVAILVSICTRYHERSNGRSDRGPVTSSCYFRCIQHLRQLTLYLGIWSSYIDVCRGRYSNS